MNEQELAERFSLDADRIIRNPSEEIIPAGPVPEEYIKDLDLARFMVSAVLTGQCGIREELRRSLLDRLAGRAGGLGDSGELDDDQLDMVAAGIGSEAQGDSAAVFGCRRSASDIKGSICPDCGRPRGLHPKG
ncbi:hypothetical protein L9W92_00715 [Pelotomaculum terephthalicicum JT]|uniref:hypothetical protein n=1 Tax=Pelotomaculum terephthalicicum TaxID=206393 RepID=UPI001F037DB9|nr:hypothetical protein [Pelotomaculum terephthalicicum]MCG9966579.1 hypothetical protein [Pelotomaculum terephthalicicum JT]